MINTANDNVLAYQKGEDSTALVEQFKSFIQTYVRLIKDGQFDKGLKHIRFFISLCIKDDDVRYSVRFKKILTNKEKRVVDGAIRYIQSYFYLRTEDDIFNELLIPFLRMSKRFELREIPFDIYVIYNYSLSIKTYLREISREPDDFIERSKIENKEVDSIEDIHLFGRSEALKHADEPVLQDLHDYRFMRGDTDVTTVFSRYSNVQRFIIVHYYEDHWTDKKIAEHLGIHRQSVSRTRLRIVQELENMLESRDIKCARISEKYITVEELLALLEEENSSESSKKRSLLS